MPARGRVRAEAREQEHADDERRRAGDRERAVAAMRVIARPERIAAGEEPEHQREHLQAGFVALDP